MRQLTLMHRRESCDEHCLKGESDFCAKALLLFFLNIRQENDMPCIVGCCNRAHILLHRSAGQWNLYCH